jgi:hypothetical protein
MNWAVGILTAPRPLPTLEATAASLARAGWPEAIVVPDSQGMGHFRAWLDVLTRLVAEAPLADAYLVSEDDAVFCRGLREYLDRTLWPADRATVALCSLFTPEIYRLRQRGWHVERRGLWLVSSVAWAIPPEAAREILAAFGEMRFCPRGADSMIGQWATDAAGLTTWYHTPSLAQHVGLANSALGDNSVSPFRVAMDFIGEDAVP